MAEAVVDLLEVVDVGDHEREAGAGQLRVRQIGVEPLADQAPVGEAGQRVGLRLAAQPRHVAEDADERPAEAGGDRRAERERHHRREQDELAVALRKGVDRLHGLDGEHGRPAQPELRLARRELGLAEHDPVAVHPDLRTARAAGDHFPVTSHDQRGMRGHRGRGPHEGEQLLADRHARSSRARGRARRR